MFQLAKSRYLTKSRYSGQPRYNASCHQQFWTPFIIILPNLFISNDFIVFNTYRVIHYFQLAQTLLYWEGSKTKKAQLKTRKEMKNENHCSEWKPQRP